MKLKKWIYDPKTKEVRDLETNRVIATQVHEQDGNKISAIPVMIEALEIIIEAFQTWCKSVDFGCTGMILQVAQSALAQIKGSRKVA